MGWDLSNIDYMKRVLQIFSFQKGYKGGVATLLQSYMDGKAYWFELSHLNIPIRIKTPWSKINNFLFFFTQQRETIRHIKASHYDIIHIHTSREFLFLKDILLACMIHLRFCLPVVMTIHVGDSKTVYNRIKWFRKLSIRLMDRHVSKLLFLSMEMKESFFHNGLGSEKCKVLYNFHDLPPVKKIDVQSTKTLRLLYVGAIHREKGVIELLTALTQSTFLDFHLNVCGELTDLSIKEDVDRLKLLLGNTVTFKGYVCGEEKTRLFLESDLLILPSYHEGLPLVIMEALGAGCAIMTTPVGAIPEILSSDNCIWIEAASATSIKEQLSKISRNQINEIKNKNKKLGTQFSFRKHVSALCEIYNSLL